MKRILVIALLVGSSGAIAQSKSDTIVTAGKGAYVRSSGEYITADGEKFKKGNLVQAGPATGSNGSYKFMFTGAFLTGAIPLSAAWEGSRFKIKEIRLDGTKEYGYTVVFKLANDKYGRYLCTVDGALKSGELQALKSN
jgi:hypothetical protein